jgi:hypothetical protein
MPQFHCSACNAGFYSAVTLVVLNDRTCSECGSPLATAEPSTRQMLDDRVGHLIARREVARAQARVTAERWADDGGRVGAAL